MYHEDKVHSHCLTAIFHIRCPQNNSNQRSTDGIIANRSNNSNEINVETASIQRERALSLKIAYFWLLLKWHKHSSSLRILFVRLLAFLFLNFELVKERPGSSFKHSQIFDILPKIKRLMIVFCFLFSTSFREIEWAERDKNEISKSRETQTQHIMKMNAMRCDATWATVHCECSALCVFSK